MLNISINGIQQIQNTLHTLQLKAQNLRPALLEIGEDLTESTKQRFSTSTDPAGNKWKENSPVTLANYTHRVSGTISSDGLSMTKKGAKRWDSKKPLVDRGFLATSIHYQAQNQAVEIGSNLDQAAMMQFGGTKAQFSHLWGDIPARPYLGLSASDEQLILNNLEDYLV